jgi:TonB family protein
MDGEESISILVEATGRPRNLMLLLPQASGLDDLALQVVAADRFSPGTYEGVPVVIALTVKLSLQTCVEEKKDDAGKTIYSLRFRSHPKQIFETLPHPPKEAVLTLEDSSGRDSGSGSLHVYHVGGGVSSPVVLKSVSPEFTDEARRAKFDGKCLLSLLVDAQGMPQNIWVVRPLGMGLDEKAIEAVRQYRFKPAMKDGMPVPVMIRIQMNFMLVN